MALIDTATLIDDDLHISAELQSLTEAIVEPIVRRSLRVSLSRDDTRERNQDAIDLVGDIQVMLLAASRAKASHGNEAIRDLHGYAARTAQNACYYYFRTRFPERTRQENKLRYALKHLDGIALWKTDDGRWICGPATTEKRTLTSLRAIDSSIAESWTALETRDGYLGALRSLFDRDERPLLFDDVLDLMIERLGIRELSINSAGSERVEDLAGRIPHDSTRTLQDIADMTLRLRRLWLKLVKMPVRHRKALLLNLKYEGRDLLKLIPLCGVADSIEIAKALEFDEEEFTDILRSLPWDDRRIAEHLGITRQQVINLRQYTRSRLFSVANS